MEKALVNNVTMGQPPRPLWGWLVTQSQPVQALNAVHATMRTVISLALLLSLFGMPLSAVSSERADDTLAIASADAHVEDHGGEAGGHHGLSPDAPDLFHVGPLPVSNSMVVTWAVALTLIVFAQYGTRRMQAVPSGAQNFLEWLVESLYDFLAGIMGGPLAKRTFWFLATVFIFILACNWFGLIPGVGTIGWGTQGEHGFVVERPLLRGANADLNLPFAMAMLFFACWIIWSLQEIGPVGMFKHLFAPKGETVGVLKYLLIVVFFAVGFLEIVSILFRPIALGFRLYGNIYAGENMLESMAVLIPALGWLIPVPFYFLELLMGLVQALVFTLLTAVFTLLMCMHEEEPGVAHY